MGRLLKFRPQSRSHYILGSDDPRVHEAGKRYHWINEIRWIERMESFYNVADDVLGFLEIINKWLKSLANEKFCVSEELLFWVRQCEGGMTTQRIQDLLLLIRSYLYLFENCDIGQIVLLHHPGMQWEDSILIETAKSRGLHVDVMPHFRTKMLSLKVREYIEICGRVLYYCFNFLRLKLSKSLIHNNRKSLRKEVVFQLCSSAQKHVKNIVPMMTALKNRGYKPIALCWSVTERYSKANAFKQIRAEGLDAEELEKSAPFVCLFSALLAILSTWRSAKSKYQEFLSLLVLEYKSLPIAHFLWPSVRFFLLTELLPRYIFNISIRNYIKNHSPLGIKIWGEGVSAEGYLVLNKLKEDKRPLVFYWNWVAVESPYGPETQAIDLYLASGNMHKRYFEKRALYR